ncbi:MAG: hypothetical protein SFU56_14695 [Capsulimonadales bacterium]|nr:hypothetical protein [Capsulimonadales bacterium]
MKPGVDIALCAWILLVFASFWAPYLGTPLSPNMLTALYAVGLLFALVRLTLELLRRKSD